MLFEWDENKARTNRAKHGVDFAIAPSFDFANAVIRLDDSEGFGEDRLIAIGLIGAGVYVMVMSSEAVPSALFRYARPQGRKLRTMSKTSKTIVHREASPPKQSRADALALASKALAAITDEEDATITAAAAADPDSQPTDAVSRRKVGRPPLARPKRAIQLRLDADVLDRFKAAGDGWQTRMNEALRKAVGL